MKVKVSRMSGKPVEPEHLINFSDSFVAAFDLSVKDGKPTDENGWRELNNHLDVVEDELRSQYPSEKEWDIRVSDLPKIVKKYGPVSLYLDEASQLCLAILQDPR